MGQNYKLKKEIIKIKNEVEKNEGNFEKISELKNKKEDLNKKILTFNWLSDKYPMISYRMYKIATEIPDSLWLKEIYIPEIKTTKRNEESTKYSFLYVIGYARDQGQIDYFIERLKKCDCFTVVRQESTSEVLVSDERLLEFKICLVSESEK